MAKELSAADKEKVIIHTLENLRQHQWNLSIDGNEDIHEIFLDAFPEANKNLVINELDASLYKSWADAIILKLKWVELSELLLPDLKRCHIRAIEFLVLE